MRWHNFRVLIVHMTLLLTAPPALLGLGAAFFFEGDLIAVDVLLFSMLPELIVEPHKLVPFLLLYVGVVQLFAGREIIVELAEFGLPQGRAAENFVGFHLADYEILSHDKDIN